MSNQITQNPSVPSQVVQEVKFPQFVNNLGIIPTSYKDSMNYYENLAWLCKFLEETVIPTVNQNGNAVEELQGLYIELNSYVTNYFENLDVQEEINNKLDEMATTGVLQESLSIYFSDLENTYTERYNQLESDVNSQIIAINNKVTSLASGSPIPVNSTNQMTDTSKVYLLLTDGKWYYYDGTNWTAGGTYQSTGIGNGTITAEKLEEKLRNSIGIRVPTLSFTSGYYRNSNGVKSTNAGYSLSNSIELKQNEIIYICCNATASQLSVITAIYSDESPIAPAGSLKVLSLGDVLNVYKFKAPFDLLVDLSINNTNNYLYCFIDENEARNDVYEKMKGYRIPETDFETNAGHYANRSDLLENDNYSVSDPIQLYSGEIIRFHARGEGTVVSLLRLVESDGTYISTIKQTSGTGEYDVEYEAISNCYVSICSQMRAFSDLYIILKPVEKTDYQKNLFTSFIKFGVVGDSLASGEAVANNSGSNVYIDNYDYSWGQFIARNHGMNCVNFSKGGATTRTFLISGTDWGIDKLLNPANKCNAYFIGLGVNDPGSVTLGSSSDVHEDFTTNPDTFYGNYAKIIGYIKQMQPKAKIFVLTIPSNYGNYNDAIRYMATLENVYCIDLNQKFLNEYNSGFIIANKRKGHYNAIGYNYMSELLFEYVSEYMYENYEEFIQIEFIGTDYSYDFSS